MVCGERENNEGFYGLGSGKGDDSDISKARYLRCNKDSRWAHLRQRLTFVKDVTAHEDLLLVRNFMFRLSDVTFSLGGRRACCAGHPLSLSGSVWGTFLIHSTVIPLNRGRRTLTLKEVD